MLSRKRKLQKKSRRKTKKHKKPRKIRRKKTKAFRKYKRKKTRRRKNKMKGGGGCKNYKNKCDCLSGTNDSGVPCAWLKHKDYNQKCQNIGKVKTALPTVKKEYIVPLEGYKYGLDSETRDCYRKHTNVDEANLNIDEDTIEYQSELLDNVLPWEDKDYKKSTKYTLKEPQGKEKLGNIFKKHIPKALRSGVHQLARETGCNHLYKTHKSNLVDCRECVNHKNVGDTPCVFFTDPDRGRDPECHNEGKKDKLEKDGWTSTTKEECDDAYRDEHKGIINVSHRAIDKKLHKKAAKKGKAVRVAVKTLSPTARKY